MKAATFEGTGKIVVKDVPDPVLQNPGQAIVRVTHSCICGSDLWFYRGLSSQGEGSRIGHEFMGVSKPSGMVSRPSRSATSSSHRSSSPTALITGRGSMSGRGRESAPSARPRCARTEVRSQAKAFLRPSHPVAVELVKQPGWGRIEHGAVRHSP